MRWLLIGCHLLRLGTMGLLLVVDDFAALLPAVALTCLAERAAKTLEMLFATRVAGERRGTYQALFRSVANAGYALGAGVSAIGLAVGTTTAYRALILANGLSYVLAAALVWRTREPAGHGLVAAASGEQPAGDPSAVPSPWRDRGYLLFVLLDMPLTWTTRSSTSGCRSGSSTTPARRTPSSRSSSSSTRCSWCCCNCASRPGRRARAGRPRRCAGTGRRCWAAAC